MLRIADAILRAAAVLSAVVFLSMAASPASAQTPAKKAAAPTAKFDPSACFGCHEPIKAFHDDGKHKAVACTSCH